MPKMKTHSGSKKRFKVTGTGKVRRFHANSSHLMRKKSKKTKKVLSKAVIMDKSNAANVKKHLLVQ